MKRKEILAIRDQRIAKLRKRTTHHQQATLYRQRSGQPHNRHIPSEEESGAEKLSLQRLRKSHNPVPRPPPAPSEAAIGMKQETTGKQDPVPWYDTSGQISQVAPRV